MKQIVYIVVLEYYDGVEFSVHSTEQKAKKSSKTILSSYPTLYHIGEKQIPSLSKRYDILKKIPSNNAKISPLVKDLRIPEIRTNELK
jgi:hypothetical protein